MKCQILFSGKNKNTITMMSAELALRVEKVKSNTCTDVKAISLTKKKKKDKTNL